MNKKFTKTLLAGAVFSLLASVAQAETLHLSLYQGEYDDQKTNANLSTQKYQMSFDTEAGIGAIFYGTNPDVTANKDKFLFLFDAQGNITRLADGTQVKIHSEDLADFTRSITDGNYDVSGGQYQNIHNMNEGEMRSLIQKVESFKSTIGDINANTDLKVSGVSSEVSKLSARTDVIDLAVGSVDQRVESRTTVGVDADGKLTRVDGATNTIAVNDGLLALSGRTDKIDAAVVAVDSRVSSNTRAVQKNTQAIAANSRQLQEHNARLNDHQRQIRENHEEMKRAAAQSAALAGLFQPYSVGKFNATAALGGYSDKQAVAVGVGYRFNEQTAAKAGIAASDGDVSYNVGVNFEF